MAELASHKVTMTTIILGGPLAKKFFRKKQYQLGNESCWEAFKALKSTLEGFAEEIKRLERLGMRFAIFRNKKNVGENDFELGGTRTINILPVITGSKRAGGLQTIVGTIMIAAAYVLSFTPLAAASPFLYTAGVGLAAGGVIQMLSPQASGLRTSSAPENAPSYAFGSAKNTTASGNPVPICIGRRRWGGAIISASIYAEDKV